MVGQNVIAPSKFTTDGEFVAVAVEVSDVFVIVKRTINSTDVYSLEVFNANRTLDASRAGGVASQVELAHLTGEDVTFIKDGIVEDDLTVTSTNFTADDDGLFLSKGSGFPSTTPLTLDGVFGDGITASFNGVARTIEFVYSVVPYSDEEIRIEGTDAHDHPQIETILTVIGTFTYTSTKKFKTITKIIQPFLPSGGVPTLKIGVTADTAQMVSFSSASTSSYELGLNYTVQAKTMPTEPALQSGTVHGVRKRIVQVDALVDKTKDLKINNITITFDTEASSDAIAEFTGLKTAHGILGFSTTGQITISQTDPLPMTVLSLEYKMSVGN